MADYITLSARHRSRVRTSDDYWGEPPVTMEVLVEDADPIDTGLVNEHGVPIYRVKRPAKMGF